MSLPTLRKAIFTAQKRLKFRTNKQLNDTLEIVANDMAHAYRIGAEEAQREILLRLIDLADKVERTDSERGER